MPNWQTFASTLRWVRGTPLGSPEDPEVKRRMASSSPHPDLCSFRSRERAQVGRSLERRNQRVIAGLIPGRILSIRRRSRVGGQGKVGIFRTNGSAVMNLSRSACLMADSTASCDAVKLRLTGILFAKRTAIFASNPPFPGGRMIPTRFLSVLLRISFERAMAAASSLP